MNQSKAPTNQTKTPRRLLIGLIGGSLLLSATALAKPPADHPPHGGSHGVAGNACAAERRESGREAFYAAYGEHPMQACVRDARETTDAAVKACREEREADPALFAETYGTNHNGRNAFGKCVSSKVGDQVEPCPPPDDPQPARPTSHGVAPQDGPNSGDYVFADPGSGSTDRSGENCAPPEPDPGDPA